MAHANQVLWPLCVTVSSLRAEQRRHPGATATRVHREQRRRSRGHGQRRVVLCSRRGAPGAAAPDPLDRS